MKIIALLAAGALAATGFAVAPADAQYRGHHGYHGRAYHGHYRHYGARYRHGYRGYRGGYGYRGHYGRPRVSCRVHHGRFGPVRNCYRR